MANEQCKICGGSGKIPFVNRSGKVVPYAWTYCMDCVPYPVEYHQQYSVDMFDFPCSATWRNYYSELCGEPAQQLSSLDQDDDAKPSELVQHTVVYEHSDVSERNLRRLDNAEGQLTSLKNILNQLPIKKATKLSDYKGLQVERTSNH